MAHHLAAGQQAVGQRAVGQRAAWRRGRAADPRGADQGEHLVDQVSRQKCSMRCTSDMIAWESWDSVRTAGRSAIRSRGIARLREIVSDSATDTFEDEDARSHRREAGRHRAGDNRSTARGMSTLTALSTARHTIASFLGDLCTIMRTSWTHRLTVSTAKAGAYRAGWGIAVRRLAVGARRRCLTRLRIALRRGGLTGSASGRLTASSGRLAGLRRISLLRGIAVRRLAVRAGRRGLTGGWLTPLASGGLTGGRRVAGTWCWRWISAWRGATRCELVRPGRCAEAETRREERASHGRRERRTLLRCHARLRMPRARARRFLA